MTTDETAKAILTYDCVDNLTRRLDDGHILHLHAMAKLWLLKSEIIDALAKHLHKLDFAGADGLGMDETQELRYKLEALEEK